MIIHPKKMKKIFILAALAASCVNMSACDLFNAKSSNVEAARSITEAVSKDDANTAENRLESAQGTQNRGEYISQSFSLAYPQDIMHTLPVLALCISSWACFVRLRLSSAVTR